MKYTGTIILSFEDVVAKSEDDLRELIDRTMPTYVDIDDVEIECVESEEK